MNRSASAHLPLPLGRPSSGQTWARVLTTLALRVSGSVLIGCTATAALAQAEPAPREQILVLRSTFPERGITGSEWCSVERTGYASVAGSLDATAVMWGVQTRGTDGVVTDAKAARAGDLRACFVPTSSSPAAPGFTRLLFYAEGQLNGLRFIGRGECQGLARATPEPGLNLATCQLRLSDLAAPWTGGWLISHTLQSRVATGDQSDPPGYTQASIATIRLWRAP